MTFTYSKEVSIALRQRTPLVALETSVIAQGLPYPRNVEAANACEAAVRARGAVPASIAVLDGKVHIGLSGADLERLGKGAEPLMKVASRDLAGAITSARSGGTTVSAAVELAAMAKIPVFATGGIGGVHRGEELDISQDLLALSRFPVAVVCAGAKTVLDLPRTLEALEALGVPVIGIDTRDFPGFYTRATGLPLEHHVENAAQAAEWMRVRFGQLRQGGMVFALPPPAQTALPAPEVELHIAQALAAAKAAGIRGKALTPFLLNAMVERSQGRSLAANVALLVNNAQFAAHLAVAYAGRGAHGRRRSAKKVKSPRRSAKRRGR
ncbi:MAG: pseudouridine-5'-phosphate glycosidase [Myxococcota bacterium]